MQDLIDRLPSRARFALALVALAAAAGCLRGPTCTEGACREGAVCDLDGTCRPLAQPARRPTVHQAARDFGATRTDRRREALGDQDEALLGGDADGAIYLTFALPDRAVERAVLVLHPVPGASGGSSQTVRVARVRPFEGATLTHRSRPTTAELGPARTLAPVTDRPIRIDVTALVHDTELLHLAVSASGEGLPWRIASPLALDAERTPRLELALLPR